MQRFRASALSLGVFVLAGFLAAGCGSGGPTMGRVSGSVKYKGQPVQKGTVTFIATDSVRPNATGTISGGTYTLQTAEPGDGAVVGEYKIAVSDVDPSALNTELPGMPSQAPKSAIPKKYLDANTSGLTFKVESGTNLKDIDLTD